MRRQIAGTWIQRLLVRRASVFITMTFGSMVCTAQIPPTATVNIPMRDGKMLAADIYVPLACTTCPAILVQTPYNKNLFRLGLPLGIAQNLSKSPYSWVIVDWRGFYGSASASVSQPKRGEDGYDVIDWIVAQSWSNGKVGTWGPSALGVIQYQTAREQHPNHVCAVPVVAHPQTGYNDYFYGGVLEEARLNQLDALGYGLSPFVLSNPYYSLVWQITEDATWYPEDIVIPTLQIGGWYDHNINVMMDWYKDVRAKADTSVRNEQWLLVGPWVHGGTGTANVGSANQGELNYPNAAHINDSMTIDFFEHYLLGANNQWENTPGITYYELGKDNWASSGDADIAITNLDELYLNSAGILSSHAGIGQTNFVSDPRNPSPTIGGPTLSPNLSQGPYDQKSLESRSDVITFVTEALLRDISISGRIRIQLHVKCDQSDADVMIRVTDHYPDGRDMLINDGARRMRFRNGYTKPDEAFMDSASIYEGEIILPFVNYTWKSGHAIKIYISGNSSSRWNVNLQNGNTMYTAGDTNLARLIIYHDAQHASKMMLPGNNPLLMVEDRATISNIRLIPNPAIDQITIIGLDNLTQYEIYSLNGKLLQQGRLNSNQIDISALKSNFYMLRLSNGQEALTLKFVKK